MATAAGRRCPSCGGPARTAEDEVLEPWFTAACESWGVTADVALDGPARRWLEDVERIHQGSGSSPPFRAALTHGHAAGSITPEDIVHRHGPDVLRLWAATLGSGDPLSWDSLQSLADRVKEIRTALDRLVDRLHQLAPGPAPFASGPAAARPDAASSAPLVRDVALAYRTLRPDLVAPRVLGFLRAELDPFLARTAEVLHRPLEDPERRAAAASTRQLVRELCILLAPVLSFTAEATWSHLPDPGPASVFLAAFPRVSGSGDDGPGDEA